MIFKKKSNNNNNNGGNDIKTYKWVKKHKKYKSKEVERQLGIMLKPRPDIQNFSRILFTAQSIVLVNNISRIHKTIFHD